MLFPKLKAWATPLTIGAFGLMATTGLLMFFHLDSGLNKTAHEWLGWAMILGVVAHVMLNWKAFKRHLTKSPVGQGIIALFGLLLVASFWAPKAAEADRQSPPMVALQGIANAPIASVARFVGKPENQLMAQLRAEGISIQRSEQSLSSVVAGDREKTGKAVRVIFSKP